MAEIELDSIDELQELHDPSEHSESTEPAESPEPSEPSENPEAAEAQDAPEQVSDKEKLMRSLVSDDDEVDELTLDIIRHKSR